MRRRERTKASGGRCQAHLLTGDADNADRRPPPAPSPVTEAVARAEAARGPARAPAREHAPARLRDDDPSIVVTPASRRRRERLTGDAHGGVRAEDGRAAAARGGELVACFDGNEFSVADLRTHARLELAPAPPRRRPGRGRAPATSSRRRNPRHPDPAVPTMALVNRCSRPTTRRPRAGRGRLSVPGLRGLVRDHAPA